MWPPTATIESYSRRFTPNAFLRWLKNTTGWERPEQHTDPGDAVWTVSSSSPLARKAPRLVATQAGELVRPMDRVGQMAPVHGGITGGPHAIALDLATAFDRAAWPWVFGRLQSARVGDTTTQALQAMYRGSKFRVKVDGTTGSWMYPPRGVLQGGITSPLLFVLYMARIVAKVRRCVEQGYVDMANRYSPTPGRLRQATRVPHAPYSAAL